MEIKEGDQFKQARTGKVFRVKIVATKMIVLETEDGSQQVSINPDGINFSFQKVEGKEDKI
jgi:hypothetical protein